METLFHESIIDLIPLLSATETNENLDLGPTKRRIKDIVSKSIMMKLHPSFSFPSLNILSAVDYTEARKKNHLLETFSQKLSHPIQFNCESLVDAPKTLLNNISSTFLSLLDSRMNNSISVITRHVTIPAAERSAIVDILSSSILKRVAITSNCTRFRTLSSGIGTITSSSANLGSFTDSCDYVDNALRIPIAFDCSIELLLLSKESITVQLSANGSIVSSIGDTDTGMPCCVVTMSIDTSCLLQRLMSEAHRVCNTLISVASALALSKLDVQDGTLIETQSTLDETQGRQQERSDRTQESLPSSNLSATDILGSLQQDMIDMPPPPPRKKPT